MGDDYDEDLGRYGEGGEFLLYEPRPTAEEMEDAWRYDEETGELIGDPGPSYGEGYAPLVPTLAPPPPRPPPVPGQAHVDTRGRPPLLPGASFAPPPSPFVPPPPPAPPPAPPAGAVDPASAAAVSGPGAYGREQFLLREQQKAARPPGQALPDPNTREGAAQLRDLLMTDKNTRDRQAAAAAGTKAGTKAAADEFGVEYQKPGGVPPLVVDPGSPGVAPGGGGGGPRRTTKTSKTTKSGVDISEELHNLEGAEMAGAAAASDAAGVRQEHLGKVAKIHAERATALGAEQLARDAQRERTAENVAAVQKPLDDALAAVRDARIDPDQFWNSRNTGQKIAGFIGAALAGLREGYTGKKSSFMDNINRLIDRDIKIQQAGIRQKGDDVTRGERSLARALNIGKTEEQRFLADKIIAEEIVIQQLAEIGATTKSKTAKLRAEEERANLGAQQEKDKIKLKISAAEQESKTVHSATSSGGGGGGGKGEPYVPPTVIPSPGQPVKGLAGLVIGKGVEAQEAFARIKDDKKIIEQIMVTKQGLNNRKDILAAAKKLWARGRITKVWDSGLAAEAETLNLMIMSAFAQEAGTGQVQQGEYERYAAMIPTPETWTPSIRSNQLERLQGIERGLSTTNPFQVYGLAFPGRTGDPNQERSKEVAASVEDVE